MKVKISLKNWAGFNSKEFLEESFLKASQRFIECYEYITIPESEFYDTYHIVVEYSSENNDVLDKAEVFYLSDAKDIALIESVATAINQYVAFIQCLQTKLSDWIRLTIQPLEQDIEILQSFMNEGK